LKIGAGVVSKTQNRNVYVHLTTAKDGAQVKVGDKLLKPGDAAMITRINDGEELSFESVGKVDAELVVLDSD